MTTDFETRFLTARRAVIARRFSHLNDMQQKAVMTTEGPLLLLAGEIDYIHDDDALIGFAKQENAIGFLLPAMEKSQLFRGVIADGVLPRKTFSMGHSREKRYYLEGRKIK